jgi:hypothetical protein
MSAGLGWGFGGYPNPTPPCQILSIQVIHSPIGNFFSQQEGVRGKDKVKILKFWRNLTLSLEYNIIIKNHRSCPSVIASRNSKAMIFKFIVSRNRFGQICLLYKKSCQKKPKREPKGIIYFFPCLYPSGTFIIFFL